MTGEQAEKRYYELYKQFMDVHIGAYSKPLVQQEIRKQSWSKLVSEIEADVIARTLLPTIESDAMPVRNCSQCATYRTNHDVAQCEKEGCPLRTAPAEVVDEPIVIGTASEYGFPSRKPDEPQITHSELGAVARAFNEPQPKRRGRRPKNKSNSQ